MGAHERDSQREMLSVAGKSAEHGHSPGTVRGYDGRVYEVTDIKDTSYGLLDGLWGINCHHVPPNCFIPGMSEVQGNDSMPSEKENRRRYALTQEQRALERRVRKDKRETAMLKASGDKEGFEEAALRLKRSEKQLNELVNKNQTVLSKESDRTFVLSYNKDVAKDVRTVNEKYSRYHYHKDGTIVVTDNWKNRQHSRVDMYYRPYAGVDISSPDLKAPQINRNFYDKNGELVLQIHGGSHGRKSTYDNNGSHAHEFVNCKRTNYVDEITGNERDGRNINDKEKRENSDIIEKEK